MLPDKSVMHYFPTIAIGLVSIIAISYSTGNYYRQQQQALENEATILLELLNWSEVLEIEKLRGLKRFYHSSTFVGREQFKAYAGPVLSEDNNIQALEWVPEILNEDLGEYTQSALNDGLEGFEFKRWHSGSGWVAQSRPWAPVYYPVFYHEPQIGNESALGIDLGFRATSRQSIDLAMKSGEAVASDVIDLAQGGKGLLVFLRLGDDTVQTEIPGPHISGLVLAVYQISNYFDRVLASFETDFLQINVMELQGKEREVFSRGWSELSKPALQIEYEFLNRHWLLSIAKGPAFSERYGDFSVLYVLLGCLLLTIITVKYNLLAIEERKKIAGEIEAVDQNISDKSALLDLSDKRHIATINVLQDAVITIDETGSIREFNLAAESIFKVKAGDVISKNINTLMPEPFKHSHDGYLQEYMKTGIPHIIARPREILAQRNNGEIFPARLAVSEYAWNGIQYFVGVIHDLSQEKNLVEEQKVLTRQLELILDTASEGICGIDKSGRISFSNRSAESLLGYPEDGMTGLLLSDLVEQYKDSDIAARDKLRRLLNSRELSIFRFYLKTVENKSVPVEVSFCPIINSSDEPDGAVFMFRDISTLELNEKKIEAQHRALENANDNLARVNKDVEQFAYIASHDLKAPLRAIKNLALWISEDLGDKLQGESLENMHLLQNRVGRLEQLLTDLLEYSRAGNSELKPQSVNSPELVTDLVSLMGIPETIKIHVDANLPVINTKSAGFELILRNLVSNAVKHHDKPDGNISVYARETDNHYIFSVEDDGPGINQEHHEKIFELFTSLNATNEDRGSGLGLAICRRAAEQIGGRIWIDAEFTSGSRFLLSVPK